MKHHNTYTTLVKLKNIITLKEKKKKNLNDNSLKWIS